MTEPQTPTTGEKIFSDIDREVHTLDHWRNKLSCSSRTIECSDMRLVGRDHEGTILGGPGRIEIKDDTEFRFYLHGTTNDAAGAFRKYKSTKDNPYDVLEQFRLVATDYSGNEWAGGYTSVNFFTDHKHGWPLTGTLGGLTTHTSGAWVSRKSSVELLLVPPLSLPMSEAMISKTSIGDDAILAVRSAGRQTIDLLGTCVMFENEPSNEAMWITAETSDGLSHPFAERWLCEPLRILMGMPIYPRMTARNFGNGTASVTLLPAPTKRRQTAVGLLRPWGMAHGHTAAFWKLYKDILTMIAHGRDPSGLPFMEGHDVTRMYDELWQAERGSRWVLLLTLASVAEALAKSLMTDEDRRSEFGDDALASMEGHIRCWDGDATLRGRMLGNLSLVRQRSVLAFLRSLAGCGAIPDHCETWRRIRNSVMHGELVDPWSTQEGDDHLREMIDFVHGLTRVRITRG